MEKNLLIEIDGFKEPLEISHNLKKIDYSHFYEELSSSAGEINLYLVDPDVVEDDVDDYEKELVATIRGRFFDLVYAMNEGISLFDVFDIVDSDTEKLIDILLDEDLELKEEYTSLNYNLFVIERLFVEEKYRGCGYAKFLLKNLFEILAYQAKLSVGLIVVEAQPYDIINNREKMDFENVNRKERLIKLYENAGFQKITNTKFLYMINE